MFSMFLLLGSLVFMIVQRYYIKKSKREFDRVSLHSAFEGSMRYVPMDNGGQTTKVVTASQ